MPNLAEAIAEFRAIEPLDEGIIDYIKRDWARTGRGGIAGTKSHARAQALDDAHARRKALEREVAEKKKKAASEAAAKAKKTAGYLKDRKPIAKAKGSDEKNKSAGFVKKLHRRAVKSLERNSSKTQEKRDLAAKALKQHRKAFGRGGLKSIRRDFGAAHKKPGSGGSKSKPVCKPGQKMTFGSCKPLSGARRYLQSRARGG